MVTLLMQGQRLLPGGCLVVKESPTEDGDTLSFRTRCGSKKTTNVVLLVSGCCCTGCTQPIFASDAGLFGLGSASGTQSLLHWCFCQWITPTGLKGAEQHSIGIIHQNSSRAFCIIQFALMLFENLCGLKPANTFCRWIKWSSNKCA